MNFSITAIGKSGKLVRCQLVKFCPVTNVVLFSSDLMTSIAEVCVRTPYESDHAPPRKFCKVKKKGKQH